MTKNILWLPTWYPDRISPYNGDFIQRHARAVSEFHRVHVIYVVRDDKGKITFDVKEEEFVTGGFYEKIVYYYTPHYKVKAIEKLISALKYRRIYKKKISEHFKNSGEPALVHIHVALKSGRVARWVKKKFKVPYVISEHWTGYLPEAKDKFQNYPTYVKNAVRKTIGEASGISVVSDYLGSCLEKIFGPLQYKVIPNVVDTELFKPGVSERKQVTQFIHISGLDYQKDPEDILKAFEILKKNGFDFFLTVIGPPKDDLLKMTQQLGLAGQVSFLSEMPQKDLVKFYQGAQALILYSRYETFGCVLIEANACGLPVIVSNLQVFHEIIRENKDGIFVPGENPLLLAERLSWFIRNQQQFDSSAIAIRSQSLYNYKTIGAQFSKWYSSVTGGL
ncbi:MAG: glycosyltransferase [Chitinophagaceae bacterium]|nr:glycosyltransferase [Chitinophagaceae bacterium]